MTGEEKLEKVFQYINRKADFGNTLSVGNARRAAQFAYDAGRESVVESMPELEWREKIYRDEHFLEAYALGAYYLIRLREPEFHVACNYRYLASYTSLTAAKQAAKEHYKELIKQALGL